MKVLYFDCFSGISGNMTLGALLDLEIDPEKFKSELKKLNLNGYDIEITQKKKNGIAGTYVDVIMNNLETAHANHSHGDKHKHKHSMRNFIDIEMIIDHSNLSSKVKEFSKKVFREIARAEAKVHGTDIENVHFHEVGAVDSIVDIVGTAICLEMLGAEKVFSSSLHDGQGFIECQHGTIPVPVPAVMEMLADSGIPLISEDVQTELVTPTGMGIIKSIASNFGKMPEMKIDRVGYGMGSRETGRLNALRVVMGILLEDNKVDDEIVVLETNIDDMSPEFLGFTAERLLENGALDVYYTPIYMKKNRPAYMLTVLSNRDCEEKLTDIILIETSTLGVRKSVGIRSCMNREIETVNTQLGEVRVKVAYKGEFKKAAPEYEDCKEIANRTGMPIREVYEIVMKKFHDK